MVRLADEDDGISWIARIGTCQHPPKYQRFVGPVRGLIENGKPVDEWMCTYCLAHWEGSTGHKT